MAMTQHLSVFENKIQQAINELGLNKEPTSLFEPINYIMSLGGKRLRPILTLMAADLFDGDIDKAVPPALGIELFHNCSLVHDDLMDNATLRRGKPTVHLVWDDNTAILSGDAMITFAYDHITKVPNEILADTFRLFSSTIMEIWKGQQYDLDFETRSDVTEAEYLEMIKLKTAVLIGCSLKMGAIVAGAPAKDADLLYEYGINIGLAFQLKDDLLDVYGNPETFGKNIGGDITSNKKTFLLIKALKKSNPQQKQELEKWLATEQFDASEKINAVKKIYDELNLKSISENLIEKYYLASLDCLAAIDVPEEKKKGLRTLSEDLMYREK